MADSIDKRNENELTAAIEIVQHTVYKKYLHDLDRYPLLQPPQTLLDDTPKDCLRCFRIDEFNYKKGEDIHQKLSTVYNASMALGCTLLLIIDAKSLDAPADIYIGVRSSFRDKSKNLATSSQTLKKGITSHFPGTKITTIKSKTELPKIVDNIFGEETVYISSVSTVASSRDKSQTENKSFVQGIENFIDTMRGNTYTAVFIAEPVSKEEQAEIRSGYESLYSTLSSFESSVWSYNENESSSVMESLSKGISDTVTESSSHTQGHTKGMGANLGFNLSGTSSQAVSMGKSSPTAVSRAGQAISGIGGFIHAIAPALSAIPVLGIVAGAAGAVASAAGGAMTGSSLSESVTNAIGKTLGLNMGINGHYDVSKSDTSTHTTGKTTSETTTSSTTDTKGTGKTLQITTVNKPIKEMLKRLDEHLKRIGECEDYGAYSCGAYFLSGDQNSALLAANTYHALLLGEGSSVESGAINSWNGTYDHDPKMVKAIKEYLKRFVNPVFFLPVGDNNSITYTPATIVSGKELPLHLGLPLRSVYGLPVLESVAFGREVHSFSDMPDDSKIKIGSIYHMRNVEENIPVELSIQSLCSHTFITGSTGAGKSNLIYQMLYKLSHDHNKKFLVIEPAKGEYKNVFGGYPDVKVYGTNPKFAELLKINPFSFPAEISVLEHIDRLVEIFNACWPMYAAMPAVLKDAIEMAYKNKGWVFSNPMYYSTQFPTFADLMEELPKVMESSMYSADTKSDYSGALLTRVKSLTNGINGEIFCSSTEISNQILFDENIIVDISRIGSIETKSLIMGIIIMKLQEYRMCSDSMNAELKHITVLEEAHHLLRRTSYMQSQESANLQGKSVEMLTNAIAEMRTYGEGFVIADQAPNLLDEAVIRNTNTKIIFRLPDEDDCQTAGKSAALTPEQIKELAKLPAFVAAVYQNNWVEAVLSRSVKLEDELTKPYYHNSVDPFSAIRKIMTVIFSTKEKISLSKEEKLYIEDWITRLDKNLLITKQCLRKALNNESLSTKEKMVIAYNIFDGARIGKALMQSANKSEGIAFVRSAISHQFNINNANLVDIISNHLFMAYNSEESLQELSVKYHYFGLQGGIR